MQAAPKGFYTPRNQHRVECVCNICQCGYHRCDPPPPQAPKQQYSASNLTTSYRKEYTAHQGAFERSQAIRPPEHRIEQNRKFTGTSHSHSVHVKPPTTSTAGAFVPFFDRRAQVQVVNPQQGPPSTKFEATSSYRSEYQPVLDTSNPQSREYWQRRQQDQQFVESRKQGLLRGSGALQVGGQGGLQGAVSTSQSAYRPHDIQGIVRNRQVQNQKDLQDLQNSMDVQRRYKESMGEQNLQSTSHHDYPKHNLTVTPGQRKPHQREYVPNTTPLEGKSSYDSDYVQHDPRTVQLAQQGPNKPETAPQFFSPLPSSHQTSIPSLPFNGASSSHSDFRAPPSDAYNVERVDKDATSSALRTQCPVHSQQETRDFQSVNQQTYGVPVVFSCPASKTPYHQQTGNHALYVQDGQGGWKVYHNPPNGHGNGSGSGNGGSNNTPQNAQNGHINGSQISSSGQSVPQYGSQGASFDFKQQQ